MSCMGPHSWAYLGERGEGDEKGYACRGLLDCMIFATSKLIVKGKLNFKSNGRHNPNGSLIGFIANSSFLFIYLSFLLLC